MGVMRKIQIAWTVYSTVKSVLGNDGKGKGEALEKIGTLLGGASGTGTKAGGAGAKASQAASAPGLDIDDVISKATDLIPLDKAAGAAAAGALAKPLLKRAKGLAVKGGVLAGAVVVGAKVIPWYLKRKVEADKEGAAAGFVAETASGKPTVAEPTAAESGSAGAAGAKDASQPDGAGVADAKPAGGKHAATREG